MGKISLYTENTGPATEDFVLGETASGPTTNRFRLSNLFNLFLSQGVPQTALTQGYVAYTYVPGFTCGGNAGVFTYNRTALSLSGLVIGRNYLILASIVGFYNNVANKNSYLGIYSGSTQLATAHQANNASANLAWPGSMMGILSATSTSHNIDIWCAVDSGTTQSVEAMTVAAI